jgi:CHAT domain-containing protein/glutaminase
MDEQRLQVYDEQRIQAYRYLIEQLMWCEEGEEIVTLQQQAQLVDVELLEVMALEVEQLELRGKSKVAKRLQQTRKIAVDWVADHGNLVVAQLSGEKAVVSFSGDVAVQSAQALRLETAASTGAQVSKQFLLETLQMVAEYEGNRQQLYAVWAQQQVWFDADLLTVLPSVVAQLLEKNAEHQTFVAAVLGEFGNLIQRFPLGTRWLNLELGIVAYQQALTVMTQAAMPVQWAQTMNNLANAYKNRIRGDRGENIEQAISAYEEALTVRTQAAMPVEWAQTMDNLATAYVDRIRGDRGGNIEQAISAYEDALTVRTQAAMPVEWATTMHNLALAYYSRIWGDRAENIEQAIADYQKALTVMTQEAMPVDWAQIINNLANAYKKRIRGDRGENIEQAIADYRKALTVMTQAKMPVDWATTMNNLANAYKDRIRGDRAENIEQAISAYHEALMVTTQTAMPFEWAQTMNNLALAYCSRIRGDRAENIEQAIADYEKALTVRTQAAMPVEWAQTMNNLALAYIDRIRGDRAENIEQAISAYKEILTVMTQTAMPSEWATTMNNLATAYKNRIQGDRGENIEQAISAYEEALTVRTQAAMPSEWATTMNNLATTYYSHIRGDRGENIEQAISAYEEVLTVMTQAAMPVDWATTMSNLATAYYSRIRGDRGENIEQAIVAYQSSLEVFKPELLPDYCRRIARSLGNLYSDQRRWQDAIPIYEKALKASEILYQSANLLDSKAAELRETADLPRRAAYAFAHTGDLQAAALTLEQGRARGLSESLDRDRADLHQLQQSYPDLFNQYQNITAQLRDLETQDRMRITSDDRHSLTPEVHRTIAIDLRQQLNTLLQDIRDVPGYEKFLTLPTFEDVCDAVQQERPLVYLVSTSEGSLALILTPDDIQPIWLDALNETQLIDLLNQTWFAAYNQSRTNHQGWLNAIAQVTRQLWEPLMAPLIAHLKQQDIKQATLIPTGYLNFLPLHVAWVDDETMPTGKRYALDEILFTYAPNARSLTAAQAIAQRTTAASILAIDNPLGDLDNSSQEVEAAIETFPQHTVLKHEDATVDQVKAQLLKGAIAHFSCHGTANLGEPLSSGLLMSDGLLTLKDLLDLKLADEERGGIRLAILSACETGLTGIENADEAIGLPTGLLQAGVAGVIASLWSVSDLSTMMLLVRFYDLWRKEGIQPIEALHKAQYWIRDTTSQQKAKYFETSHPELFQELILFDPKYFAHPFHWAAFSYTGGVRRFPAMKMSTHGALRFANGTLTAGKLFRRNLPRSFWG